MYTTIQAAVDAAADGDEIKVAEGVYTGINHYGGQAQVIFLDKSVTIQGGYEATFSGLPDPDAHPTTINAAGAGRVLYITGDITPTIAGLRITGGNPAVMGGWQNGGGVFIDTRTSVVLEDNWVFNNTADEGTFCDYLYMTIRGNALLG